MNACIQVRAAIEPLLLSIPTSSSTPVVVALATGGGGGGLIVNKVLAGEGGAQTGGKTIS